MYVYMYIYTRACHTLYIYIYIYIYIFQSTDTCFAVLQHISVAWNNPNEFYHMVKGHMQPKIKFLSFESESSFEYFGEVL